MKSLKPKGKRFFMPILAAVLVVIFLSSFLAGCGLKKVATVNGEVIKEAEFNRRVEDTKHYYETQMNLNFEDENGPEILQHMRELVLDQMVTECLLMQEAKQRGIKVTEEQIQAQVDEDKVRVGGEQAYREALKEELRMTEAEYRQELEKQMTIEALYSEVVAGQEVQPQEVADYYQNNKGQFVIPEQIKASHILLNTEEEATAVLAQLKSGAKFEDLAVQKSVDPTAKDNQGDLGYFDKDANFVPEFIDAAFALKVGQVTQSPVKTQFGYHVIKVVDRLPSKQQTLEEASPDITEQLRQSKESDFFQQFMEDLKSKADIVREDISGNSGTAGSDGK